MKQLFWRTGEEFDLLELHRSKIPAMVVSSHGTYIPIQRYHLVVPHSNLLYKEIYLKAMLA
jgi:hypothetical protein